MVKTVGLELGPDFEFPVASFLLFLFFVIVKFAFKDNEE